MVREYREMLLKDLYARLPYGVICADIFADEKFTNKWDIIGIDRTFGNEFSQVCISNCVETYDYKISIERIKPYLFPMSSMTKEQMEELKGFGWYFDFYEIYNIDEYGYKGVINQRDCFDLIDWLNKNHFDYRGLIKKGLAIDCSNLNIY